MRVAIHHPEHKEDGEMVPGSVSAFRTGRIEDHVDLLTGQTTPRERVAEILAEQAKLEFPDCEIMIEHLHDNGDGTSTWKDHAPGEDEEAVPAGETHEAELSTEQPQSSAAKAAVAAAMPPAEHPDVSEPA